MASEAASQLKADWVKIPDECFEPQTFGELKVDQKFIGLPLPGDNSGHGGLRGLHSVFTKTRQRVTKTENGLRYGIPHGKAVNSGGVSSDFPNSMFVIHVE